MMDLTRGFFFGQGMKTEKQAFKFPVSFFNKIQ